jgi:hypothetical protein
MDEKSTETGSLDSEFGAASRALENLLRALEERKCEHEAGGVRELIRGLRKVAIAYDSDIL